MLLPCITKSQNDSAKKVLQLKQAIGVGLGYSYYKLREYQSPRYDYIGDVNFFYLITYKFISVKTTIMLQPKTTFGLKYHGHLTVGLTSNIHKKFSSHFLFGYGLSAADKKNAYFDSPDYNSLPQKYSPNQSIIFQNGYYLSVSKNKKIALGLDIFYWHERYLYAAYSRPTTVLFRYLAFSFSLNYKF